MRTTRESEFGRGEDADSVWGRRRLRLALTAIAALGALVLSSRTGTSEVTEDIAEDVVKQPVATGLLAAASRVSRPPARVDQLLLLVGVVGSGGRRLGWVDDLGNRLHRSFLRN